MNILAVFAIFVIILLILCFIAIFKKPYPREQVGQKLNFSFYLKYHENKL
jgi:hypothetical protein